MINHLTGHTCGDACWHARELVCRCSCGGVNHGILNNGGDRPQRTCQLDGNLYELAGIVSTWSECDVSRKEIQDERFPGLDWTGYGDYREEKMQPVVDRKISDTQARWPEVAAIAGARRLIWSRPAQTEYIVRGPNSTHIRTTHTAAAAS